MGSLEQAGASDQEPVEPHGARRVPDQKTTSPRARGSKSIANGVSSDTIAPGAGWGPIQEPIGP